MGKRTHNSLIAKLRKEAGYTQKTLAEVLHITDKAVSKWERGLSLPDVSLLPKLSLLLGADMSFLLSGNEKSADEKWIGLIDLREYDVDLWQTVYDKPMVYFLLSHFLLADVREICFLCSKRNQDYLQQRFFAELGFVFHFEFTEFCNRNLMILNRPCFLFGSDLTRHFQGAMVSQMVMALVPENIQAPFLFCPAKYASIYQDTPESLYEMAIPRTLGRGMVCLDMDDMDKVTDVAAFVKVYQRNCGLLISSLEEISFKKGIIPEENFLKFTQNIHKPDIPR